MSMDIILDKICDELEEHAEKIHREGKLTSAELKEIGELVDIKKNILKTEMLEEDGGYSQAGDWEAIGRGRFGDYDRGNSYANRGQHYVRGHYSRSDGRRDRMGRYSRNGGESLMEHVDMMLEEAETPQERELIKRFKKQLENH